MNDEEIEEEVSRLRTSLSATKGGYTHDEAKAMRPSDVHARAAAKAKELDNFGKALGIRSDYQTGQAFDRDLCVLAGTGVGECGGVDADHDMLDIVGKVPDFANTPLVLFNRNTFLCAKCDLDDDVASQLGLTSKYCTGL